MKFLKNPFFKIIGVSIVLYFALFNNKYQPDSLANRLAPEKIKENLSEVREKSSYILENISKAEQLKESKKNNSRPIRNETLEGANPIIRDLKNGIGEELFCNDKATITYKISNNDNKILEESGTSFVVGSEEAEDFLSTKLIGIKKEGSRLIILPSNYQSENKKINDYLKENKSGINYEITLIEITKSNQNFSCEK